ncbi:MAG: hypothetical protein NTW49_12550 [Bacteroidia bacterium]|nr:hypothetical protein [Bacteroidia bacterium]
MKHFAVYLFLILAFPASGQNFYRNTKETSGHLITLSLSNNGQIYDVIDEFYFSQGAYLPNNDVFTYKQNDAKLYLQYEYLSRSMFSLFGRAGYSFRKDNYTISNVTPAYGSKEQYYLDIALGFKYNYNVDKFLFSTGIEMPYYKISTYKEKFFLDSSTQTVHYTQYVDGGNTYGLNSISSIKFFMTDNIFLSADFAFGLMMFNLGGQTYMHYDYQNPVVVTPATTTPHDDSYNKFTVTKPEFCFGIGIKIF